MKLNVRQREALIRTKKHNTDLRMMLRRPTVKGQFVNKNNHLMRQQT